MGSTCYTDDDGRPPVGEVSEGLGKEGEKREQCEDEHGAHTGRISIELRMLVHDYGRQFTTIDGEHGDGIEHKDKGHSRGGVGCEAIHVGDIGGDPEEEEPPHTVGEALAGDHGPCLGILEALAERNHVLVGVLLLSLLAGGLAGDIAVLLDIGELGGIDAGILGGFLV